MTREEMKDKLMQPNSGSEAFNKGVKQANSRANRLFKKIFDHFEQRTCEGCEYWKTMKSGGTVCADRSNVIYGCLVHKDFSCNKWSQKP